MIRIILSGCCGLMGQVITDMVQEHDDMRIVAGIDTFTEIARPYPVFSAFDECTVQGDILLDFSRPAALDGIKAFALKNNLPIVIATTGYTEEQKQEIKDLAHTIPVFTSGNMSLGINLMLDLIKTSAKILGDEYDIEILEKHHNQKVDAPSGTALMLADALNEAMDERLNCVYGRHGNDCKRKKYDIGIHSMRGGTIVGEHTVLFAGHDEFFEITHKAQSRQLFATGALKAARFLVNKPAGMYCMSDVISKDRAVTQVYADCTDAVISINNIEVYSDIASEIFAALANAEINIDMISRPAPVNGQTSLSFSLPQAMVTEAVELLYNIVDRRQITILEDVCKLSVEGIGMKHQYGAASSFFNALDRIGVPIYLITTSEIKIACCIPESDAQRATEAIKQQFQLV